MTVDLSVAVTPLYFATMAAEDRALRRRAEAVGPTAADYQRSDTIASLAMGVGSLAVPVCQYLGRALVPGKGRFGRALLAGGAAAVVATSVADRIVRRRSADDPRPSTRRARQVAQVGGVASVVAAGLAVTTGAAHLGSVDRLWQRGRQRDLGRGPLPWAVALVGWDLAYYWNHRFMHEVRAMWAIHVVHHSSERYNLSTALRQPVASAFGVWVPYGLMARVGVRPSLIAHSRSINLIYQYWIHTDTIRSIGRAEAVLNTPSHHRVHHGSNRRYIDRNHGGILILWDRLFGTFAPEDPAEPVVYGLTANVGSFRPWRVATHEYRDMFADIAASTSWRDRWSFVLRSPGWAYRRRAERAGVSAPPLAA